MEKDRPDYLVIAAEALIALVLLGLVAVIVLRMFGVIRPDEKPGYYSIHFTVPASQPLPTGDGLRCSRGGSGKTVNSYYDCSLWVKDGATFKIVSAQQ